MRTGKKSAPASAATLTGAVENGTSSQTAHASINDSIISAAGRQFQIADLLLHGEENALPMKHLKELTGMDSRTIRLMIQQERLSGTPICANNKTGYYLPGSDLERAECVKSMRHRSAEIARTADAIEQGGDRNRHP